MMRTLSTLLVLALFGLSFAGCADDFADLSAVEGPLDLTAGPDTSNDCLMGAGEHPRLEEGGEVPVGTPYEFVREFYHFCEGYDSDDEVLGTTVMSATEGLDVEVVTAPPVGGQINESAPFVVHFTPTTVGAHEATVRFSVALGNFDFTVTLDGI